MLCELCTSIFSEVDSHVIARRWHHPDLGTLQRAIQDGCYICSLLGKRVALKETPFHSMLSNMPGGFWYSFTTSISSKLEYGLDGLTFFHRYGEPLSLSIGPAVSYSLLTFHRAKLIFTLDDACFLSSELLSDNTKSEESFGQIFEWLQNCLKNHSNCSKSETRKWLPRRLIFVGSSKWSKEVRLCDSESAQEYDYVTLSHRWGQKPIFCLKAENIQDLRNDIPTSELPKNFQDAISITRRLDIKYIWIDSLCIIQDSRDDWLQESAQMCDVYKYAVCNLAATGFDNGEEGLFTFRSPTSTAPCTLNMTYARKTGQDEQSVTNVQPIWLIESRFWEIDVSIAPLNCRAWVVQERALSPRTVHFGKRQLFWECKRLAASETFPRGFPRDSVQTYTGNSPKLFDQPFSTLTQGPLTKAELKHELYKHWERLVHVYTMTNITYSSDNLIAISGLAKEFRSLLGNDDYLAGLWQGNFSCGLLWTLAWDPDGHFRSEGPNASTGARAPTWSWASINRTIEYQSARWDARTRIRVLEAKTTTEDGDATMNVTGGFIRVEGSMKRIYMQVGMVSNVPMQTEIHRWGVDDIMMRSQLSFHYDFRCLDPQKDSEKTSVQDPFENLLRQPNMPIEGFIFCLLIQSYDDQHVCLALVPTGAKGKFQRIGVLQQDYSKFASEGDIWQTPYSCGEETYCHRSVQSGAFVIDIV